MPGPTTEVLYDDLKELRGDVRQIQADVRRMDNNLTKVQTEFAFAKWFLGTLLLSTLAGIGTGIWWAATITANVKGLEMRTDDKFSEMNKRFEDKFSEMNKRFDKFEESQAKLLEQTKPKP